MKKMMPTYMIININISVWTVLMYVIERIMLLLIQIDLASLRGREPHTLLVRLRNFIIAINSHFSGPLPTAGGESAPRRVGQNYMLLFLVAQARDFRCFQKRLFGLSCEQYIGKNCGIKSYSKRAKAVWVA